MIPFPGESLGVYSFENRAGDPIDSLSQISSRAGASFFGPGASAKVVVFLGSEYLETDADPGEVSWCVEIAGGTGSLTLTECLGNGEPDVLLGTFAVTPGVPLVVPSSVLTLVNVFTDTWASLLVECTGAAVMVQQVKLRAFPTGGPLGGWGDTLHPAWERTSDAAATTVVRLDGAVSGGSAVLQWSAAGPLPIGTAWANTTALMPDVLTGGADETVIPVSLDESVPTTVTGQSSVTLFVESYTSPPSSSGEAYITGTGFVAERATYAPDVNPAEGLVDGVDYIANPYEVPGDVGVYADADTDPENDWVTEYVVAGVPYTLGELIAWEDDPGGDPPLGQPLIGAIPWEPTGAGETLEQLWPDHAAVPPVDLTLPDVDQVLIGPSSPWFRDAPATPPPGSPDPEVYAYTRQNGFTWNFTAPIQYVTAMPAYRVWEVTTTPTVVHKLRQYHRDDGLGVAPRRAYGGASRQHTRRAYGYT